VLLGEQACRPIHVEGLLGGLLEIGEGDSDLGQQAALPRAELGVAEAVCSHPRPEPEPGETLVEIAPRPLDQAGVDLLLEGEDALGDAAVGSDHHHHHHPRLKPQYLDPVDRRRLQRRRRHQRDKISDPGEGGGRVADRLLDLSAHPREAELARGKRGEAVL
jgi:hypothetical protein